MKLSAANMAILKNMSDLMTRELWGAYEDSYKQRILQLKKVRPLLELLLTAQVMAWMHAESLLLCTAPILLLKAPSGKAWKFSANASAEYLKPGKTLESMWYYHCQHKAGAQRDCKRYKAPKVLRDMQVTDCYSEPHMFVEVSDLQPWVILSLNAGALKTTGEIQPPASCLHIRKEWGH